MRYAEAALGQISYGIEDSKYEKAADPTKYVGLVVQDVSPPNPNPHTAHATGGTRRGPHVHSPDEKEYTFDVPFLPIDANAPFEIALGERTTTVETDFDRHVFTEKGKLPTATFEHQQADLGLQQWYIGSKADLQLSASRGGELEASMSITAAKHDFDDDVASGSLTELDVPKIPPYKFWMAAPVTLSDPETEAEIASIATLTGFDLSWTNGLTAEHHGSGRDAYAVAEETAAEKYDHTATANVTNTDVYKRAAENEEPVDVEIPLYRDPTAEVYTDAVIIRLEEAVIVDAAVENPNEGTVGQNIGFAPRNTEIEIRSPN